MEKMHQTEKVRVHLGILCVLRTYLLSYLTLTEISYYPGISLGLEKLRSKQTEKNFATVVMVKDYMIK